MRIIQRQVVLVLILIQVLMYVGCECDKTEENNGTSEISVDKSYQCREIENPPIDFQNCYSINYMDTPEQYMVYIARKDENLGK